MEFTGLTPNGHPLWSGREAGNLVGGYPDYSSVLALDVRRTRPAHHSKALRLQITRPRAPEWQLQEIATVRRTFAREPREAIMAAVPARSWASICRRGWSMGLRRPRRPYRPTGDVLIDQTLGRLWSKRLTKANLDVFVGRRDYFQRGRGRGQIGRRRHTSRRFFILGGTLRARAAGSSR